MRLLLDTHALIWFMGNKAAIRDEVKALIRDPGNQKFISVASLWEIFIKVSLG